MSSVSPERISSPSTVTYLSRRHSRHTSSSCVHLLPVFSTASNGPHEYLLSMCSQLAGQIAPAERCAQAFERDPILPSDNQCRPVDVARTVRVQYEKPVLADKLSGVYRIRAVHLSGME